MLVYNNGIKKNSIFKRADCGYMVNLWDIGIEVVPIAINLDLYGNPMCTRHVLYGYIRPLSSPSTSALSRYTLFIFPSWPPRRVIHELSFFSSSLLFFLSFELASPRDLPEDREYFRLFSPLCLLCVNMSTWRKDKRRNDREADYVNLNGSECKFVILKEIIIEKKFEKSKVFRLR